MAGGSGFLAPPQSSLVQCLTFSHMLGSQENRISWKPGDCTLLAEGMGWFDLTALPNEHINPTILAPAGSG